MCNSISKKYLRRHYANNRRLSTALRHAFSMGVILQTPQKKSIEKNASFVREEIFSDTYFDTKKFSYTTKNIWLRKREGSFELKVGIKKENGSIDRYEEILDSFKTHRKKCLWMKFQ